MDMNVDIEKEKKTLSIIIMATGVLLFIFVIGIVIFSLPDTTGEMSLIQEETTLAQEISE